MTFTTTMTSTTTSPAPQVSPSRSGERLLRMTLRVNAVVSILSGLVLALAPAALDDLLGTGRPGWVRLVGGAVALFGVDALLIANTRIALLSRLAPGVIAADGGWVLASAATIALGWYSPAGVAAVVAMAAAVGTFGALQFRGWRTLARPHNAQ